MQKDLLDIRKVCRLFAKQLLQARNNLPMPEFMELWLMVAGDFSPDVSILVGLALIENNSIEQPPSVVLFDSEELPLVPEERFQRLFMRRDKWRLEELKPYITGLLPDAAATDTDKAVDARIVKHCRISTRGDGVKHATTRIALTPY